MCWSIFHCFHLELKEVIQRCIPFFFFFFSYSIYKILHGLSDNVFRKREPQFEFSKTQKKKKQKLAESGNAAIARVYREIRSQTQQL